MHIFCPEIPRRRFLPARLLDSWNETVASQVAEADAADPKLAIHGPRPATNLATALDADPFARQHLDLVGRSQTGLQLFHLSAELDVLCFGCHRSSISSTAEQVDSFPALSQVGRGLPAAANKKPAWWNTSGIRPRRLTL